MELFSLNKMKIRFWTRIDSINEAGDAPLNCYVILNKVRCTDFSVDLMIPVSYWNSKKQQVNLEHPLAEGLNRKISFIKLRLMQIEMQLCLHGEVTAKMIKDKFFEEYKTKKIPPKPAPIKKVPELAKNRFADALSLFLEDVKAPLGISKSTKKNNKTFIKNITKYLKASNQTMIEVAEIDVYFTKQFNLHVKKTKPQTQQVHINRHISFIRAVLDHCVDEKIIKANPLGSLKLECNYPENPESFEIGDIDKIKAIPSHFLSFEQNQVRDIFLFMIGTGMDFCDYEQRKDHWLYREEHRFWVKYTRQKTITYKCPDGHIADTILLPDAVEILLKYGGSLSQLPNRSLNEINEIIKEVYKLAKIIRYDLKKISTKLARKTYANLQSNYQGFSDESVAYLMGHTTTKHIKKYRKYKKIRVLEELKKQKNS